MANWALDFQTRNNIDPAKVAKRAKHSIHVRKPGGEIEATFVGAPCHYQDSRGNWQAIDTALRKNTVSNRWYAPGVPVDISASDGSVSIYGGSWAHKTSRVGIWDSKKKTFAKAWDIPELGAVDGDSFVRSGKGWEYRQRVTESGLREELTLFQKPSITLPAGTWLVLETYVPGLSAVADGERQEWSADGMWFPLPSARDSNVGMLGILPCKRWKSGSYLYTGIQAETFEKAVYPVVVDPDFSSYRQSDHYTNGWSSISYANSRLTSSSEAIGWEWGSIGSQRYPGNSYFYTYRAGFKFDTSSIPDDQVLSAASFTLPTSCNLNVSGTISFLIKRANWSSYDPPGSGNRESRYDLALSADTDGTLCTFTAAAELATYTANGLSTAYINKAGYTYYAAITSGDRDASPAPANVGDTLQINFGLGANTEPSYRPYLSVTYYYPHHRTLLGVGT